MGITEYGVRLPDGRTLAVMGDAESRTIMSDADYARTRARALGGVPMSRQRVIQVTEWQPLDGPTAWPGEGVAVTIQIMADGRVTASPEFHPSEQLPDLPSLLRYVADHVQPEVTP